MNSPVQAILWKNFRLTWKIYLIYQLSVIAIALFVMGILAQDDTGTSRLFMLNVIVGITAMMLLAAAGGLGNEGLGARLKIGFPHRLEYSLPVTTNTLVCVTMLYFLAYFLFAYLIPMVVVGVIMGVPGPQIGIALMGLDIVFLILAITWWTNNSTAHFLTWAVALLLYFNGWLYPEVTMTEETGRIVFVGNFNDGLIAALSTTMFGCLLFFGVKKQRYGEALFGLNETTFAANRTFHIRQFFPMVQTPCPTDSLVKAEIWRERQLRGFHYAISFGLLFGLLLVGFLGFISNLADVDFVEDSGTILLLSFVFFFALFTIMQASTFGVNVMAGPAKISVFDKSRPISSAKLVLIKFIITNIGLMTAGITMTAVLFLLGPIFINGFDGFQNRLAALLATFNAQSGVQILLQTVVGLAAFACYTMLFSSINLWGLLKPRLTMTLFASIPIYVLALVSYTWIVEPTQAARELLAVSIAISHSWLIVLCIPAACYMLVRAVISNKLLATNHFISVMAICLSIGLLYLFSMINLGLFTEELHSGVRSALMVSSLLPVLAVSLILWTMARIRHG